MRLALLLWLCLCPQAWAAFGGVVSQANGNSMNGDDYGLLYVGSTDKWVQCSSTGNNRQVRRLSGNSFAADTSFNFTGVVSHDIGFGGNTSNCFDVAVDSSGRYWAIGNTTWVSNSVGSATVSRYTSTGTTDSFSGNSNKDYVDIRFGHTSTDQTYGRAITIQADGRPVIAGIRDLSGTYQMFLARLNIDGSADTGFGTGGVSLRVTLPSLTPSNARMRLQMLSNGRIALLAFGGAGDGTTTNTGIYLGLYEANGQPVVGFGGGYDGGAIRRLQYAGYGTSGISSYPRMVVDAADRIVLAAGTSNSEGASGGVVYATRWAADGTNTSWTRNASATAPGWPDPGSYIRIGGIHLQPNGRVVIVSTENLDQVAGCYCPLASSGYIYDLSADLSAATVNGPFAWATTIAPKSYQKPGGNFLLHMSSASWFSEIEGYDYTPNAITFSAATGATPSTTQTSNTVTVTGITATTAVTVSNGEYSVNGGAWSSSAGTIANNDTLTLSHTASSSYNASVTTTATVGGVSATYQSTTFVADSTPNALTFSATTNAALNSYVYSSTQTVSGINAPTPISVTNGEYRINSGAYTTAAGSVNNGDTVTLRQFTGPTQGVLTTTTVTIGGIANTWDVTTLVTDTTPAAFSFTDQNGVDPSTFVIFSAFQVTGINAATPISITNGQYSINGGSYTGSPGVVNQGDYVTLRLMSSASFNTAASATLDVGGVQATATATTAAADTTPNAFSFTNQTGVSTSSVITFAPITVSGINSTTAISINAGAEYSVNGGAFGSGAGTVSNGQSITVRHTSSSSANTTVTNSLTIGGVSAVFSSTTAGAGVDTTPDAFLFASSSGATAGAAVTSNTVTITGINSAATISITGGEYAKNGGAFTATTGSVSVNDSIAVRVTASGSAGGVATATLIIGGVAAQFTVVTSPTSGIGSSGSSDTIPDPFSFPPVSNAAPNAVVESISVTITGTNAPANISINGGEYSVGGAAWTSNATQISSGQTLKVRLTTPATAGAIAQLTVTVGGVSSQFLAVTSTSGSSSGDTTPDVFSFAPVTNAQASATVESAAVTITGINAPASVSISGGQFSIQGGAWSTNGQISNGQTLKVRLSAAATAGGVAQLLVTVGGVSVQFQAITASSGSSVTGNPTVSSTSYIYPRSDGNIGLATTVEVAGSNVGKGGDIYFFARVAGQFWVWGNGGWTEFSEQAQNLGNLRLTALPAQFSAEFLAASPRALANLEGVEIFIGYGLGAPEVSTTTIVNSPRFKDMIRSLRYEKAGYFAGGQFIPTRSGSGIPGLSIQAPLTLP